MVQQYEQRKSRRVVFHLSWGLSLRLCHTFLEQRCLKTWELGLGTSVLTRPGPMKLKAGEGEWKDGSFTWCSVHVCLVFFDIPINGCSRVSAYESPPKDKELESMSPRTLCREQPVT